MKHLVYLTLLLLCSCAFFQERAHDETYLYLKGDKPEASVEEYEKSLTRKASMGGGYYQVEARPMIAPYLKKKLEQRASLRGFNGKEKAEALKKLEATYLSDKTCFEFTYEATRFDQVAQLKNWSLSYVEPKGDTYPLEWLQNDLKKSSIKGETNKGGIELPTWLGSGVACGHFKTAFDSGFALKVKPEYVQFPFDSYTLLSWDFPKKIQVKNDETGKVEEKWEDKKAKSYKRYRGW